MEYPNTGVLFTNTYKTGKQPDFKGNIILEVALVKQLLSESNGDSVQINLSGWTRQGRSGGDFVSLSYDAYKKPEESAPSKYREPPRKPASDEDIDTLPF